jgi:hypothetical protein
MIEIRLPPPTSFSRSVSALRCVPGSVPAWVLGCALLASGCAGTDGLHSGRMAADAGGDSALEPLPDAGPVVDDRPERYPQGTTQSPLTDRVKQSLLSIAGKAARTNDVFAKVGDSLTASPTYFLGCFAGESFDLNGDAALEETRMYFLEGNAGGNNPFSRTSLAATVGWSAYAALAGSPSPLSKELAATDARYAVVLFGTNDIGNENLDQYADNMLTITDQLIANGTVPILSSVPPRAKYAGDALWVGRMNAVMRGIAEGRRVPFVDYHHAMDQLAGDGLAGDDVHPNAFSGGSCMLSEAGLAFGYNTRNAVTLAALDRVRRLVSGGDAPDEPAAHLDGEGTYAEPFEIKGALPFAHLGNTATSAEDRIDNYTGCSAAQDESGAEVYYEFDVAVATNVRIYVLDRGSVDVDVHLLGGMPKAEACVQRDHREIAATLTPGKWYIAVDSFVSDGVVHSGEYLLAVIPE